MPDPAEHFSATAAGYAATMAPSLRPVAAHVIHRARVVSGERVLDVGTGTGIAAAAARAAGAQVLGVDAAEGMLEIARVEVPDVEFRRMDFRSLTFEDGTFDVVLAVHALLFADDQVTALTEWRRVTRPGGRLSLSVPGPSEVTPTAAYAEVYERHGIDTAGRYPTPDRLAALAREAGWTDVEADADPMTAIVLPDEAAFRTWRGIGMRGPATAGYTSEEDEALTREMLAVTPRDASGTLRIPFGTIYLVARR